MRYNTGNPVGPDGSSSPFDLHDNAGVFDQLMNGPLGEYLSRLGMPLKSWRGMMQQVTDFLIDTSYESVFLEYAPGVVVERQTQLVQRDGELFRVLDAADIPLTLSGDWSIDAPKLQSIGDFALRQALAQPTGAEDLVGGALFKGEASDPDGTAPGTTVTRSFGHAYYPGKAGALRVGGSDLEPLNDERGYWSGLPSQNSWGDMANIGLYSQSFGRNGASYKEYSTTFGHDCVTYGVASIAGGAGSATGNPGDPNSAFAGYCSLAWGKNVLSSGEKSMGLGEEHVLNTRAAFGIGNGITSQPSDLSPSPVGAGGAGWSVALFGQAYGFGAHLNVADGMLIGTGIIGSAVMQTAGQTELGLGYNSSLPLMRLKGAGVEGAKGFVGINNQRTLNHSTDIDVNPNEKVAITIDGVGSATLMLSGLKADGSEQPIAEIVWTNADLNTPSGGLLIKMHGRTTPALIIDGAGSIQMPEIKTAATVSGSPAGTVYRNGNNLEIV